MGIKYLTVYGFSTENWKRSEEEVGALMQLFRYYMVRLLKIASANNVRVKMIGDRRRFAFLSGYRGYPGSGSADPYQRRVKTVQLSAVAAGIYRTVCYRLSVAGF